MIKEAYTWEIVLPDGSCVGEYDRPEGRGFAEVDSSLVKKIMLQPNDSSLQTHCVDIPAGATPVFFRRRSIELSLSSEEEQVRPTTHCIGWKQGEKAVYLFVFNNGSTLLTDNLQAV